MPLSSKEIDELTSLKKLERQYEGIIRTATNAEQQQRAKVDLKKIKDKINELDPNGNFEVPAPTERKKNNKSLEEQIGSYHVLSRFNVQKASPHCTNNDVNLMYTILSGWEMVFRVVLSEKHVKLDFSLNAERDTHYTILENIKRYHKMLAETLEDYAGATRDDAKLQLADMRRRYERQYLNEGAIFLRKMKDFWSQIDKDIMEHGTKCTNPTEKITFDTNLEEESFLRGESIAMVVHKSVIFLDESLDSMHLPEIPKLER